MALTKIDAKSFLVLREYDTLTPKSVNTLPLRIPHKVIVTYTRHNHQQLRDKPWLLCLQRRSRATRAANQHCAGDTKAIVCGHPTHPR